MKKLILLAAFLFSTSIFAGTCKIKARVYESVFSCPTISINKIKDVSLVDCQSYVEQAQRTNLFGIIDIKNGEKIMHIDYKFKEGRYKVKDRIVIEDWVDHCGGGIL